MALRSSGDAMTYPILPNSHPSIEEAYRKIALVVNRIMKGKTNNTGSLILTNSTTTTTVTLQAGQLGENTVVLLVPTNSDAAAETEAFVSARDVLNNQFTITHSNDTSTRTFSYVLVG